MSKRKSTARSRKTRNETWEDQFADEFKAQPAQLTTEQVYEMESAFVDNGLGTVRRAALATLSRSGQQLMDSMLSDRDAALSFARSYDQIADYTRRLRSFADMMESASVRIAVALCAREDMPILLDQVKAENSGQAVGHG
jgi:hypothetical protein